MQNPQSCIRLFSYERESVEHSGQTVLQGKFVASFSTCYAWCALKIYCNHPKLAVWPELREKAELC
jgi:hypothetical protein